MATYAKGIAKTGAVVSSPKEGGVRQFWHRHWMKFALPVLGVATAATLYFATGREEKPVAYQQNLINIQSVQPAPLKQQQVEELEKTFVGAQRLKVEFGSRKQDYINYLSAYSVMVDDIAARITDVKDEKRFFAQFLNAFKAGYWKKNADRQDDALYKSVGDGWYDCDGATIVLRDVAAKLGKQLTIYFAWKVAPGLQTGHSFAAGEKYAFETAYSQMFPAQEIGKRYPFVYGKSSGTDGTLFSSYEEVALSLYSQGKYGGARELYTKAIESNPSAPGYFSRGNCYLALKEYDSAEKDFIRAIEIWPDASLGYKGMGLLCQNTNRHAEAVEYYRTALEKFSDDPSVHYWQGLSYMKLGRHREAIDAIGKSLELDPNQDTNARKNLENAKLLLVK